LATLSEIRAAVLRNLDRANAPASEYDDVDNWINQVIREIICRDHNWSSMEAAWSRNTVADYELYSWPDSDEFKDCEMILLRASSTARYVPLDELSENQVRWTNSRLDTSKPRCFSRRGNGFRLRPVPDVSTYGLLVVGWKYPATMTADSNTNEFTLRYSRLVELWATARGFEHYGESERGGMWRQMAQAELTDAVNADRRRLMPAHSYITPSPNARRPDTGKYARMGYLAGYY